MIYVSPTQLCACGLAEQTDQRPMQDCSGDLELRKKNWPDEVTLNKVYGTKEELKRKVCSSLGKLKILQHTIWQHIALCGFSRWYRRDTVQKALTNC